VGLLTVSVEFGYCDFIGSILSVATKDRAQGKISIKTGEDKGGRRIKEILG